MLKRLVPEGVGDRGRVGPQRVTDDDLTERRLRTEHDRQAAQAGLALPADGRPLPSVAQYDELLTRPATGTQGAP